MKDIDRIREIVTTCADGRGVDVEDVIEIEQLLKNIEDLLHRRVFTIVKVRKVLTAITTEPCGTPDEQKQQIDNAVNLCIKALQYN